MKILSEFCTKQIKKWDIDIFLIRS